MNEITTTISIPAGVSNYRTQDGWSQSVITPAEDSLIQQTIRDRNREILVESLADAKELLRKTALPSAVTPTNVRELATFLAERRIVHISRVYDDYLKAKVEAERRETASPSAHPDAEAVI